jgi:hypothetical protein
VPAAMILQLLCSIRLQNRGRVDNTYASFSFSLTTLTTRTRTSSYVTNSCLYVIIWHKVVNGMGDGRTSSLITAFAKYFFPPFSASIKF